MLNPPSVHAAISNERLKTAKVSGLIRTGLRPAAALACDSSLVGIQVLSNASMRWIS